MNRFKTALLVATLAPIGATSATAQQREPWPGYDAYVNAALATWKVPGVGIAIIRKTRSCTPRASVREMGMRDPSTRETNIFAIGSSSKPLPRRVAMLSTRGKSLGYRLRSPLPAALRPVPDARSLHPRLLASYRTRAADMMWYGPRSIATDPPPCALFSLRGASRLCYQNLMYLAAARSCTCSNTTGYDFVTLLIFHRRHNASNTTIRAPAVQSTRESHAEIDDTVSGIRGGHRQHRPAARHSNVVDMARGCGAARKGSHRPQLSARQSRGMTRRTRSSSGSRVQAACPPASTFRIRLGCFLHDYRGTKVRHQAATSPA